MKMLLLTTLMLAAAPALAADPIGRATFAPGTETPARLVVGDALWTCAGSSCSGPSGTRTVTMQRACRALARKVGAVAGFTVGAAALPAAAVTACNQKAGRDPQTLAAR